MTDATHSAALARRAMLFCCLVALCEGLDLQAAGVAAGGLSREFQPSAAAKGLFFSASTAGLFVGAVFGGWLADRIGRKQVLVGAIGTFGLFSLLTASATDMHSLTLMRLLTGLGLGGAMPNLIAFVAETAPTVRRNLSIATMYMAMPLGGAVASLIILLAAASQWRLVFLAGGLAPLVIAPLMALFMPGTPVTRRIATGGPPPVTVLRELFGHGRALRTLLLWVSFFFALLVLYLLLSWLPTLLEARGMSKDQAAAAQVGFNVGGSLCALLMGALLDSRHRRASIVLAFLTLIAALFVLAAAPVQAAIVLSLTFLLGGAVLAAQTILYGVAADCYSAANRGVGVGTAVAIGRLGSIAGPMLGGILVGAGRSPPQVLTGILPVVIICALGTTLLGWGARARDS